MISSEVVAMFTFIQLFVAEKPLKVFECKNTGLRSRVRKGFSFIVTAFNKTLKLTQQVSKNCRQKRKEQKNAYHPAR